MPSNTNNLLLDMSSVQKLKYLSSLAASAIPASNEMKMVNNIFFINYYQLNLVNHNNGLEISITMMKTNVAHMEEIQ